MFWQWTRRVILMAVLAILVVGFLNREQLLRLWSVNSLFSADRIVANFSGIYEEAFTDIAIIR